jgi:hypothetical protein
MRRQDRRRLPRTSWLRLLARLPRRARSSRVSPPWAVVSGLVPGAAFEVGAQRFDLLCLALESYRHARSPLYVRGGEHLFDRTAGRRSVA